MLYRPLLNPSWTCRCRLGEGGGKGRRDSTCALRRRRSMLGGCKAAERGQEAKVVGGRLQKAKEMEGCGGDCC